MVGVWDDLSKVLSKQEDILEAPATPFTFGTEHSSRRMWGGAVGESQQKDWGKLE